MATHIENVWSALFIDCSLSALVALWGKQLTDGGCALTFCFFYLNQPPSCLPGCVLSCCDLVHSCIRSDASALGRRTLEDPWMLRKSSKSSLKFGSVGSLAGGPSRSSCWVQWIKLRLINSAGCSVVWRAAIRPCIRPFSSAYPRSGHAGSRLRTLLFSPATCSRSSWETRRCPLSVIPRDEHLLTNVLCGALVKPTTAVASFLLMPYQRWADGVVGYRWF